MPKGFVPSQDKRYLVAIAQLPDAASLDRTEAVIRRMADLALQTPGVEHAVEFPGLSITSFGPKSNAGVIFFGLKPFEERRSKDLKSNAILMSLNQKFAAIQEGFVAVFPPPAVPRHHAQATRADKAGRRRWRHSACAGTARPNQQQHRTPEAPATTPRTVTGTEAA